MQNYHFTLKKTLPTTPAATSQSTDRVSSRVANPLCESGSQFLLWHPWLLLVLLCTSESSFNLFPSLLSRNRLLAITEAFFLLTVILSPVNFVLLRNLQRRSSDQLSTWHTGSPQRTWYNIEHSRGGRGYQHFLISCITYI